MLSLRLNIARSASEMDRIASLWNELLRSQSHSMFQSFAWNRLAAEVFRDRITPHVISVESHAGAAIIPAVVDHATGGIELLGDALFDYRDVLHAGDAEILSVAWRELAARGRPLRPTAIDSIVRERWPDFCRAPFANAPRVERSLVDESAFRLAHSRLGRQCRRLNRLGVSLHRYSGEDSAVIRHVYECKRTQFAAADSLFTDQRRCDFIVAVAAQEGVGCEVFTMERNATLVAALVSFRDGKVRRCYTIYFNPEWAQYSPGVALLYEVTARSLGEGLSCDYMTGEYPYKQRLANAARALYKVEASVQELRHIAGRQVSRAA